jgi:hypothetical protein
VSTSNSPEKNIPFFKNMQSNSVTSRKGLNILCRYKSVVTTEDYNVIVNTEELLGATENLTL